MQEVDPTVNTVKKIFESSITNSVYPKVDIIIPTRGDFGKVIYLISTIFKIIRNVDYQIIVVVDGKESSSFSLNFKDTPRLKIYSTGSYVGFGAAINFGVSKATAGLICVLHNDIKIFDPNFLINLVKDLVSLSKNKVVSISSVTNNTMSKKLDCMKSNKAEDIDPLVVTDVALPFICNLFYKKAFIYVKGMPEYPYCWFECDLFAEKLKKVDMKQAVSFRSYVQHDGGGTILKLINKNPSLKSVLAENLKSFQEDKKKISGK